MIAVTLATWNKEWSNPNSGCIWQGTDKTDVSANARGCEVVEIVCEGYNPMYGAASASAIRRMEGGAQ